jgi:Recombination endonuclease VII
MDEKVCTRCGETKPLTEFGRSVTGAGGLKSQCRECQAAYVRSRYVPRVHAPEEMVCPQCGEQFTHVRTAGPPRIYCSRKCAYAAGDEFKRQRNAGLGPRRCACGAEVTTRVGKPVCPECRKDPRPDAQIRERRRTLRTYGLTQADWDNLLRRQGNRCAICRTEEPGFRSEWDIDHDHVTDQVRGLLCGRCNRGIGQFHEDPAILMAAAQYLITHRQLELPATAG